MRGMFIRLAQGNVDPNRLDAWVADTRTLFANNRQQPGFRSAYHAINRERARSVIIQVWDTHDQLPNLQNAAEAIARLQSEFGLQPEEIVDFEVVDQI